MIYKKISKTKKTRTSRLIINKHKLNLHPKGVIRMQIEATTIIQSDDDYMKEVLSELGIDMSKSRKRSRMPKNKFGITVIRGAAGKDMVTMYREEKGRC